MKYVLDIRTPTFIFIMVLSLFAVVVTEYLQNHLIERQYERVRLKAQGELAIIRSNLEAQIYSDIYYANSLATLASVNPDSTDQQWELIAEKLFSRSGNLRNIGIAPNDVIEFVYPLQGNEEALGFDYRTVPEQWQAVQRARELKSIFITGPVELVQGGLGFMALNPIFTDPPDNRKYWGTSGVIVDIDALFLNTGVKQLQQKYHFAIQSFNGGEKNGEIFYGDSTVFDDVMASEFVSLPSGSWHMAVSSQGLQSTTPWYRLYSARLIGYPMLLIVVSLYSVIYMLSRAARTNSLQEELTNLPNRRYFMYSREQAMRDSAKKGSKFTLLNLDLNYFKSINDTYGHAVGDIVLVTVAERIRKVLRASDLVARVGGDEFLVLLPRVTDEENIHRVIENLHQEISSKPIEMGYNEIYPKTSIGYVIYADSDVDIDTVLHLADINMYKEKQREKQNMSLKESQAEPEQQEITKSN